MADRSHKFTTLFTKTLKISRRPTYAVPTTPAWAGTTNVMSSTVVIATTAITSGWLMPSFVLENMAANSGDISMPAWVVKSANPGTGFVAGTVCSYSLTSSYKLHWSLASQTV